MTTKTQSLLQIAIDLPPDERVALIDQLYQSLDTEDEAKIEALWAQEAEERVRALDAGLIDTIPAEEVFKKLER